MTETSGAPESPSATVQPAPDSGEFVEVSELLHADAGNVQATHVAIEQSTVGQIKSDKADITQSAIRSITAGEVRMDQSASAILKSDDTALHDSAIGIATAGRIDLFGSTVGIARGSINVGEGASSRVLVQIGGGANAPRPLLNAQSALTLGAGIGLSGLILGRLVRRILGEKRRTD